MPRLAPGVGSVPQRVVNRQPRLRRTQNAPPQRPQRRPPVAPPRPESGGTRGIERANRYKRTRQYRQDLAAARRAGQQYQRQRLISQIQRGPGLVRTPKPLHRMSLAELHAARAIQLRPPPTHIRHQADPLGQAITGHVVAPGLFALQQTTRPLHGIVEAIGAVGHGHQPVAPFVHGFLHGHKTFSDLGIPGLPATVLDIALDPTTYLTGGRSIPGKLAAKGVAESAGRRATAEALRSGASRRVANRAGRAAAAEAVRGVPMNRGLTLGIGATRLRTSGKTTAAISRKLKLPNLAETMRVSKAGQLTRHINPNYRAQGVSREQHLRIRDAARTARGIAQSGEHEAKQFAIVLHKHLGPGDHPKVIDALEKRDVSALSPKEVEAVNELRPHFNRLYDLERQAKLIGQKFQDFGYFPRRPLSELAPENKGKLFGRGRARTAAQLQSSKFRTNRQLYEQFRGGPEDLYTQNVPIATYLRSRESAALRGRAHLGAAVAKEGRPFHPNVRIGENEAVYKYSPRGGVQEVSSDELKTLYRDWGKRQTSKDYLVLNRGLVKTATAGGHQINAELEDVGRIWDRTIQGRVKTILTVPNPQYHLTNLYGDLWKAYTAEPARQLARNLGISAKAMSMLAKRNAAARTIGKQFDMIGVKTTGRGGRKLDIGQELMQAERHGAIGSGFLGADLPGVLEQQGRQMAERVGQGRIAGKLGKAGAKVAGSRVGAKLAHPIDAVRDVSQYREDWVRFATYLGGRKRGLTPAEAARHSLKVGVDYGDLTTFERTLLRRVLPFYTFTARNVPQQVEALLARPGKFATLQKVREEGQKATGAPPGYEGMLKDWEQRGLPVPVPGLKDSSGNPLLLFPKLPATDISRLDPSLKSQTDYFMSMLSPVIKAPIELGSNYNFFFRDKIDKLLDSPGPKGQSVRTLKPAPAWLVAWLPAKARDALHIQRYRDKTGKELWGWPAKLEYLLKQTPLSGTALQFGTGTPNSRGQTALLRGVGYGTGLKLAPFDPKERKQEAGFAERAYLQALAQAMRDQGEAYDKGGGRTKNYQKVLDRTRLLEKQLGVTHGGPRKKSDPLAQKYGLGSSQNLDSLAKKYGVGGSGPSVDDLAKKYGVSP